MMSLSKKVITLYAQRLATLLVRITLKKRLFELLQTKTNADIELTESFAMFPAAAVSGWYFSHPESRYFGIGKITKDQLESLAERKDIPVLEIERWPAPVLGYED